MVSSSDSGTDAMLRPSFTKTCIRYALVWL
jgi:hypothetical protein